MIIGGIALASFLVLTGRRLAFSRRAWLGIVGASVFFSLDLWFWHRSIVYIGPGLSTLLANLQVFFMMAGGILLLGQRPSALQLVAVPLAVLGLAMIVGPGLGQRCAGLSSWRGVWRADGDELRGLHALHALRASRVDARRADSRGGGNVADRSRRFGAAAMIEGESLAITRPIDIGWMLAYGLFCHALA